jgi:hypothetical protein
MTGCAICGASHRTEEHHVGRAKHSDVKVDLCVPHHRRQTRMQHDAGVFRESGGEVQRAWAILHGCIALLMEQSDALDPTDGGPGVMPPWAAWHRAMLRLLTALADEPLGPDPIASTLRAYPPRTRPATAPGTVDLATAIDALVTAILPAIATLVDELVPGTDEAALMRQLTERSPFLANEFAALEPHPRADAYSADAQRTTALMLDTLERLATLEAAHPDADESAVAELSEQLTSFRRAYDRHTDLIRALAAGEDTAVAFERLLAAIDTEQTP